MSATRDPTNHNCYFPSLVLVAAVVSVPILASLLTIVLYLSPSPMPPPTSIPLLSQIDMIIHWLGPISALMLLGLVVTLALLLVFAVPGMRFATAEGGRLSDYQALDKEYQLLNAQYQVLSNQANQTTGNAASLTWRRRILIWLRGAHQTAGNAASLTASEKGHQLATEIRLQEVGTELKTIKEIMNKNGLTWVLGTGYVSLWNRVNGVNEAMIEVLPDERLIEDARYDQLRLKDSNVPDEKNLRDNLDAAIKLLRNEDPPANQSSRRLLRFALKKNKDKRKTDPPANQSSQRDTASNPQTTTGKLEPSTTKADAKTCIYQTRCALHKFTNERWDGLVRARNHLMGTALLTGIFTYILVVIAIRANTPQIKIEQAIVFYFLGAIVGLFSRLHDEFISKNTVKDDYGQTMARTLVTPLLSGLAALVGVFLVTMLSIALITPQSNLGSTSNTTPAGTSTPAVGTTQPASSGTTAGTTNQEPIPTIATIYDLDTYPQNLVLAAFFGFLPSLVIGILKKQTDRVESEIQSSSAGDQKQIKELV